ncbi:hypothetical protein T492DRAFT_893726, partial [Pavlovales sp. CCMP2436]
MAGAVPALGDAVAVRFPRRRRRLEGVVTALDEQRACVLFFPHYTHELAGSSMWVGLECMELLPTVEPEDEVLRVGLAVKVRDDADSLRWVPATVAAVRACPNGSLLFLLEAADGSRDWRGFDDTSAYPSSEWARAILSVGLLASDSESSGQEGEEEEGEAAEANTRAHNDEEEEEEDLQTNEAVVACWGRSGRTRELDGLIVDEQGSRLLVEFLTDGSK